MNKPIFILACSPRSGSTWLQRVITSTGQALIWGESTVLYPWGNLWTLDEGKDPKNPHDLHKFRKQKANMWMAILNPLVSDLQRAHKRYMIELYGETAKKEGFSRWGKKETAWAVETIDFLVTAWPKCQIIFLTRRFDASFTSRFPQAKWDGDFKAQMGTRAKDIQVWCKQYIQQHRAYLARQYLPQQTLVYYEDLVDDASKTPKDKAIRDFLNWLEIIVPYDDRQILPKISCTEKNGARDYSLLRTDDTEAFAEYAGEVNEISEIMGYKLAKGYEQ